MSMDKVVKKLFEGRTAYVFTNDDLRGLPPRNLFMDRLVQSIAFARRHNFKVGVLAIDLNTFNEETGESDMTDELLKLIGQRIVRALRETDTISSQGVDEFIVILPDVPQDGNEMLVAQKVFTVLNEPFVVKGKRVQLSPHIGVTLFPDDAETPEQVVLQANIAMIEAKALNAPIMHVQSVQSTT